MIGMKKVVLLMVLAITLIFGLKVEEHNLLNSKIKPLIPEHDQNGSIKKA